MDFPELDPTPITKLDPRPVLQSGKGIDGYVQEPRNLLYYRIEPIVDSSNQLKGAFVLARHGYGTFATIEQRRNRILMTTSLLIVLLSLLVLILVRRSVTQPINQLIRRIKEISQGQREQGLEIKGRDEVASLAREFNLMCQKLQESHARLVDEQQEKLKLEHELRHSERLASVGRLAAGLAHEIGTPLAIIGGRSEYLLRRSRSSEELKDNLGVIRSQSDRIAAIVRQLLEFSRRREPVFQPVELLALLDNVKYLLAHQLREKDIQVEMNGFSNLPEIDADPDLLQQVFINLFSNSLHALGPGGIVKIGAEITDRGLTQASPVANRWLRISFEDNGLGIDPEHIGRVFDPFFTTKDVGEGTGLGLSVSYGIIQEHRGDIHVESEPGRFTRFIIYLPTEQPKQSLTAKSPMIPGFKQETTNPARILVVDDDREMCQFLADVLGEEGYRVEMVHDGPSAVQRYRAECFDLTITDLMMPRMRGTELVKQLKEIDAHALVLLITAFGSIESAVEAMHAGAFHYVTKPFRTDEILLQVKRALEQHNLQSEVERLRQQVHSHYGFENIIGQSARMREIFELIAHVSDLAVNVLIVGESGTGKEMIARAIHQNSARAAEIFHSDQLRSHSGDAFGERALRLCPRRLYRRPERSARSVSGGWRRLIVSRRNQRNSPRSTGQTAARYRRQRSETIGNKSGREGGCPVGFSV